MKSIADAFADRLAALVNNIDAAQFNPVQCCVCAVLELDGRVQAVVRGYGVCTEHILVIEEGGTVTAAITLLNNRRPASPRKRAVS